MKYRIDSTVDCVFKAILGSEENKNLLVHFLNAVLELTGDAKIVRVELVNPYMEREFQTDKLSIVDVKAKDALGTTYQVDIQLSIYSSLKKRMLLFHPRGEGVRESPTCCLDSSFHQKEVEN